MNIEDARRIAEQQLGTKRPVESTAEDFSIKEVSSGKFEAVVLYAVKDDDRVVATYTRIVPVIDTKIAPL